MSEQVKPMFAVVELFGHARIAGAVTEQTFGGSTFVRVDVPEIRISEIDYDTQPAARRERTIAAHTRSFGPGAIYSINWCDEETAKLAAIGIKHEPLKPYSVREALDQLRVSAPRLTAPRGDGFDEDDQQY